jgi:hypothetical protein
LRLGRFPSLPIDFLDVVCKGKRAPLVADDDVGPFVAAEIADDDLRSNARLHIDPVRDEPHLAAVAFRLKPV